MSQTNNFRYQDVKNSLLAEIKQTSPNGRLSSRNELAKRYNVARTTIERAISELIGEGYLYSRDGSGTYVAETQQTKSIGVIIPDIMHEFYPGILRGVEDAANETGLNVTLCNMDNDSQKQSIYIDKLLEMGVRGIVIVPAIGGTPDLEPFKRLQQRNIPFVFCNRGYEGIDAPRVTSNNFYGAYIGTKHLINQGFHRIAYISPPVYSTSLERYQGYISALEEASLQLDEEHVVFESTFDAAQQGYESMLRLLAGDNPPDAVFCFNDNIAAGACQAAIELGLIIGETFAVVGCNNSRLCESLPVKLSSLKFNTYEIGYRAFGLLNSLIQGESIQLNKTIVLPTELIIRASSKRRVAVR